MNIKRLIASVAIVGVVALHPRHRCGNSQRQPGRVEFRNCCGSAGRLAWWRPRGLGAWLGTWLPRRMVRGSLVASLGLAVGLVSGAANVKTSA
jgi:hypothetical protein